jgi:hypothetical protein
LAMDGSLEGDFIGAPGCEHSYFRFFASALRKTPERILVAVAFCAPTYRRRRKRTTTKKTMRC